MPAICLRTVDTGEEDARTWFLDFMRDEQTSGDKESGLGLKYDQLHGVFFFLQRTGGVRVESSFLMIKRVEAGQCLANLLLTVLNIGEGLNFRDFLISFTE